MTSKSLLPVCGDTVYWPDYEAGHGTHSGIVEQCDNTGVLVSNTYGYDHVRFERVRYEQITQIIRATKGEKP